MDGHPLRAGHFGSDAHLIDVCLVISRLSGLLTRGHIDGGAEILVAGRRQKHQYPIRAAARSLKVRVVEADELFGFMLIAAGRPGAIERPG